MKKITLDAGHGYNTPGKRTPNGVREWSLNDAVCRYTASFLSDYDVEIYRVDDTSGKTDVPLQIRTDRINNINPDISVSVHHNANTGAWGTWTGVEVYSHPKKPERDAELAKRFVTEMSRLTGLKNRGAKKADFYMIRETKSLIPSVLCEGGFMDSMIDEPVITSEEGQKAYAQAITNVCVSYLQLRKKFTKTLIAGKNILAAEQMTEFLLSKNNAPLIKCTPIELARLYLSEGTTEGIRGDIAFCQAIQETGWFRFGNDVLPEQNNYCGLGATNTTEKGKGAWFDTPQLGVRAHIQHLKAYSNQNALYYPCVDPRFSLVMRGSAPNWQDLDGKWAIPGVGYGEKILAIYNDIDGASAKLYKVQIGAFAGNANAIIMVNKAKAAGYSTAYVTPIGTDKLYRVQVGAFADKDAADSLSAKLKADGFCAYIGTE